MGSVAGLGARVRKPGSRTRLAGPMMGKKPLPAMISPISRIPRSPLEGMENVFWLKVGGIMGGEGPARGWSE